jgi:hypothetical protein
MLQNEARERLRNWGFADGSAASQPAAGQSSVG